MNEHIDNSAQEAAPADGHLAASAETERAAASDRSRTTRRRLIKGAAVTAAAAGALYVKPDLRSFGLPVALAASGGPGLGALCDPCTSNADCASGFCKDDLSGQFCSTPDGLTICF